MKVYVVTGYEGTPIAVYKYRGKAMKQEVGMWEIYEMELIE